MFYHKLKLLLFIPLMATLLLGSACTTESPGSHVPETEEVGMDPQTQHEVQMLVEAFPEGAEYFEETVIHSVIVLKDNGVGSFTSIENVTDEEISDLKRKLGIGFLLDIVDDTDERFRVGFAWSGVAKVLYPPSDSFESVLLPPPPVP